MKAFYCTIQRGEKTGWLLGPFASHQDALDGVQSARDAAYQADPRSYWDAFGTSSIEIAGADKLGDFPKGLLS